MEATALLEQARVAAGLSQEELARRAGTSRPTLSAYEHGRKSPTLATAAWLLAQAGFELATEPVVRFREYPAGRGRTGWVADLLPRLPVERALARVALPLHLNWSSPGRTFELRARRDRARVYEVVPREGQPEDIHAYVDGALLVDQWDELVLPRPTRAAWQHVIDAALDAAAAA